MTLRREGSPTALAMQEPSSTGSLAPWARRGLALAISVVCACAGLALASHYPLSSTAALAVWVAFAMGCAAWPRFWLVAMPALLPIIGWAPWSGWITFEEFDGLVLAAAAAGYGRYAFTPSKPRHGQAQGSGSPLVWLLVALLAASLATAMARGFADAGGFVFGLFQGYREPMNSVRLAKSLFAALLLFPLWSEQHRQAPQQATQCLTLGLVLGLAGAALATVWERAAFTGLLNFSTDYRTTALFWEMHVGGAALDGFLGMSVPFLARELLVAQSRRRGLTLGCIALLAAYACLTTFSRIPAVAPSRASNTNLLLG